PPAALHGVSSGPAHVGTSHAARFVPLDVRAARRPAYRRGAGPLLRRVPTGRVAARDATWLPSRQRRRAKRVLGAHARERRNHSRRHGAPVVKGHSLSTDVPDRSPTNVSRAPTGNRPVAGLSPPRLRPQLEPKTSPSARSGSRRLSPRPSVHPTSIPLLASSPNSDPRRRRWLMTLAK